MHCFVAKLVFQITVGDGLHSPQFNEQLRLVYGSDNNEAYHKASQIGQIENQTYYNYKQEMVTWNLVAISELIQITEMQDGAELYSQTIESSKPEQYIADAKQRQELLEVQMTYLKTTLC